VHGTTRDNAKTPRGSRDRADTQLRSGVGGEHTVDDYFLDRAIDLAWMGAGQTQPNPLVGAVVVKDGEILGEGYHPRYGEDHAETIALERAGGAVRDSTLYATLEPCAHQGNTPPCADQVIESGVSRVVVPTLDPDDRVNGRGVRMLRERGIRVEVGRRAERAMLMNMAYLKTKLEMGPAVTLKIAVTLDGKIASRPGKRDEITGQDARAMVHRLRAVHDAVLVGIETVLTDAPRLDCRFLDRVNPPVPVVLDSDLRLPTPHTWLAERRAIVVTSAEASKEKEDALLRSGARVIRCAKKGDSIDVAEAVAGLHEKGVSSLLVEGGGRVFSSFVDAGVWDGMFVFVSPTLFGPDAVGLADRALEREDVGAVFAGASFHSGDVLLSYINTKTRDALRGRLL
jgi:diaminohydroxyphosphoribosylaminopyrimidine deaminase/5-amino-6-(5-phosphoribosylamino)uracil reductase